MQGVGVVFHPNPLDAQVIGGLVEKYKVTFLVATPTFLQAYMRRCTPESFGSLQYVLAGAEKLPERVAAAFEDQFGIRPLEGYGCTECSPVVTVNGKDYRASGFRQVAARRGKIGHPLPGVSVKVVDIEIRPPSISFRPQALSSKNPDLPQTEIDHRAAQNRDSVRCQNGQPCTGDQYLHQYEVSHERYHAIRELEPHALPQ